MRGYLTFAALAALMGIGCGATVSETTTARTTLGTASVAALPLATALEVASAEAAPNEAAFDALDRAGLPEAPWSAAPLSPESVPAPVLRAWAGAPNRASCAPLAPAHLGAGEGARARVSAELVEGGWAVEFDRRGLPGLLASGASCARCGRGVFGIAGTPMAPEQLATEHDVAELPAATYADGSHLEVEGPAEGESVAAASLTVRGQGCVYQVWSFLGETHVRELVTNLRRVETREAAVVAAR